MDFTPIDQTEVNQLFDAPQEPRKTGARKKKDLFDRVGKGLEEMIRLWFQLTTQYDKCDYCSHNHMVATKPDESKVCRRCYITQDDLLPAEEREGHEDPQNVLQNYA